MKFYIFTYFFPLLFLSSAFGQGINCPANVLHGTASTIGNLDAKRGEAISATRTKATLLRTPVSFAYRTDLRLEQTGLAPGEMCLQVTRTGDVCFEPCNCNEYAQVFYFERPLGNYGSNEYLIFNPYSGFYLWNDGSRVKYEDYEIIARDGVEDKHVWVINNDNFFAGVL